MPKKKGKFRWGSLLAGAVTLIGILADPHILALLPAQASVAIAVAGVVIQAVTKPVARKEEERTPQPRGL